jgi:hypothetical protein
MEPQMTQMFADEKPPEILESTATEYHLPTRVQTLRLHRICANLRHLRFEKLPLQLTK